MITTITPIFNASEITDGITAGVEARQQRGLEITALARIEKVDGVNVVTSVTNHRPTKAWANSFAHVRQCQMDAPEANSPTFGASVVAAPPQPA
jgi:hypothetical protein